MEQAELDKQKTELIQNIFLHLPAKFSTSSDLSPDNLTDTLQVIGPDGSKYTIKVLKDKPLGPVEFTDETTGIRYEFSGTTTTETGLRIFKLKNLETKIEINYIEWNEDIDAASAVAFLGAATSRKGKKYSEIAGGFVERGTDATEKLEELYVDYRHDSPAGMAPIAIGIDNISIADCLALFYNLNLGDGQELSTRYVKFALSEIMLDSEVVATLGEGYKEEITQLMQGIQDFQMDSYKDWIKALNTVHDKYFREELIRLQKAGDPKALEIKDIDEYIKGPVKNRTLDIARNFLPLGGKTKFYLVASARIWRDLIKSLRESNDISHKKLAEDIHTMFKIGDVKEVQEMEPKMVHSELLKHSTAKETAKIATEQLDLYISSLPEFKSVLESRDVKAHGGRETDVKLLELGMHGVPFLYIMGLYPNLNPQVLFEWLKSLSKEQRTIIGNIIMFGYGAPDEKGVQPKLNQGHHRHDDPPRKADYRSYQIFVIRSAISYLRDYNRHRSASRMLTFFENADIDLILSDGFNSNYQLRESIFLKMISQEEIRTSKFIKEDEVSALQQRFLKPFAEAWDEQFGEMYLKLRDFNNRLKEMGIDKSIRRDLVIKMLPLGHQATMYMSIPDDKQPYIESTRGAEESTADRDLGYVEITKKIIESLNGSEGYFTGGFQDTVPIDVDDIWHLLKRG